MALRGCNRAMKYSMFLFNAVILLAGGVLVGFGIYTRTTQSGVSKFSSILGSNLLPTVALVFIVTGSTIIFVSFLGCCGSIKEVRCMLVTFFVLLLLMFLGFLVGAIILYAFRHKVSNHGNILYAFRHKIEDLALNQLELQLNQSYGRRGEESVTEGWDYMQQIFHCCGVAGGVNSTESWAYYRNTDWFYNNSGLAKSSRKFEIEYVPLSCCKDTQNTPNVTKCQGVTHRLLIPVINPPVGPDEFNDQLYTEGCYTSFNKMLSENVNVLAGLGVGIALAMIIGMVFSMCLCRGIKGDYYECD